jgi:4'-phosphopantetheinyl transferase EntD
LARAPEVRSSLPSSIFWDIQPFQQIQGELLVDERGLLGNSTRTREREIVAGRVLAHNLMVRAGLAVGPVLRQAGGAPMWPVGMCGSIAHSYDTVAVALAPVSAVLSLGIDIEDGRDLDAATMDIADRDELEVVMQQGFATDPAAAARFVFCVKEALFKCQSSVTGDIDLGFSEVRIQCDVDGRLRGLPNPAVPVEIAKIVQVARLNAVKAQGVMAVLAWIPAPLDSV